MDVCLIVRQVIPVIRSNETQGTPDVPYNYAGRKKRSSDSEEFEADRGFFDRPLIARKTDRAARSVRADVQQTRVLNKKLRFFRMANLKEKETVTRTADGKERRKQTVVPRVSHPFHLEAETNRKIQYVPRWVFRWSNYIRLLN